MADLWEEVNNLLLASHEKLKIQDIKSDIKWLYKRKKLNMPEIVLFESAKSFNTHIKEYNYENEHKYGLKNEIEFIVYHRDNRSNNDLDRYCEFILKGVFDARFTDHKALICMLPKKILVDDKNNFHSLANPAIQWHDSEGDKYYISGRKFGKKLFLSVRDRKMKMISVLKIKNIEQRFIVLRLYGIERMLKDLDCKLIDSTDRGNKLYSVEIDEGITALFLVYKGISTSDIYTKFVDHHKDYKNADLAQAESHNMTLQQYLSLEHTG